MVKSQILYDDQTDELVERCLRLYRHKNTNGEGQRAVICLAGVPGSGKSTLSSQIVKKLNAYVPSVVLPQDGFHLYRRELQEMANSEEAIFRRGASFTFNSEALLKLLKILTNPMAAEATIKAPSFNHELKDPTEDDIVINGSVKIIILEGNYVLLNDQFWNEIVPLADDSWFIDVPLDIVRDRIIKRHIKTGIVANEQEAIKRVDGNDLINAKYIIAHSQKAKLIVKNRNGGS